MSISRSHSEEGRNPYICIYINGRQGEREREREAEEKEKGKARDDERICIYKYNQPLLSCGFNLGENDTQGRNFLQRNLYDSSSSQDPKERKNDHLHHPPSYTHRNSDNNIHKHIHTHSASLYFSQTHTHTRTQAIYLATWHSIKRNCCNLKQSKKGENLLLGAVLLPFLGISGKTTHQHFPRPNSRSRRSREMSSIEIYESSCTLDHFPLHPTIPISPSLFLHVFLAVSQFFIPVCVFLQAQNIS